MKGFSLLLISALLALKSYGQPKTIRIEEIDLDKVENNSIVKCWLKLTSNSLGEAINIPIWIAKGKTEKPILGLTAAIHGNELNGIKVIQEIMAEINIDSLHGTIIAIPGLNTISILNHQRRFIDSEDLNRKFPGKENGNRSEQYAWHINQKILNKIDYLVDMHTASFGRENTLYVRADLSHPVINKMAFLQDADIILNNKGTPSTSSTTSTSRTMRAEAMLKGIPSITIEYGNPQVFQPHIIERGKQGILNLMSWLKMISSHRRTKTNPVVCERSYWIYVEQGGYLEVIPELNQKVSGGDLIGILRNPFGDELARYFAPEDGIVIGKSSNPINMSGGRIIHLGLLDKGEK